MLTTNKLTPAGVVRAAIARLFGPTLTPLQMSHGALREATARRWGIPIADRRTDPRDVVRPVPNRADRVVMNETIASGYCGRTININAAPGDDVCLSLHTQDGYGLVVFISAEKAQQVRDALDRAIVDANQPVFKVGDIVTTEQADAFPVGSVLWGGVAYERVAAGWIVTGGLNARALRPSEPLRVLRIGGTE